GQRRDRPYADRGRPGVLAEVGWALAVLLPGRDRGPTLSRPRADRGADRVGGGPPRRPARPVWPGVWRATGPGARPQPRSVIPTAERAGPHGLGGPAP